MTDFKKLIATIKQYPQIWDRNHSYFNNNEQRELAWINISNSLNIEVERSKEAFRSIVEKYINAKISPIDLTDSLTKEIVNDLKFLEPHLKLPNSKRNALDNTQELIKNVNNFEDYNKVDFDKSLIKLVKITEPLWDRNCNMYCVNKSVKEKLWCSIAQKLNRDVNFCMNRWKGLREKYIRQKMKYQIGEYKWELLDEMSFLDKVILYRKKSWEQYFNPNTNSNSNSHVSSERTSTEYYQFVSDDSSVNEVDTPNDLTIFERADSSLLRNEHQIKHEINTEADSSNILEGNKRSCSFEMPPEKKSKKETDLKSPETLFGEFVAALLAKKGETEKSLAMIEIIRILSK